METKKNIISTKMIIFFFLIFNYNLSIGQSLQKLPESEYITFLNKAASLIKANYEKIDTWQGEFNIKEENYYYGEQCQSFDINSNDPAAHSKAIERSITLSQEFAIDVKNNKLYCSKSMPKYKFKALDLNKDILLDRLYSPITSIVTSDEYLSFMPNLSYGYGGKKVNEKRVGKKAFRWPLERAKNEQWGDVRDPRKYFSEGNKMIWEELESLSNYLANPPSDIPEGKDPKISIMREGTKIYIKALFYRSETCKGCDPNIDIVNINMILDSSARYNLIHREVLSRKNEVLQTMDIVYENTDGVFVPKTIDYITFRSSDLKKSFNSKISFVKSILNVPINKEMFTYKKLGLKNGEIFVDKIARKEYKYEDANLVLIGDINDSPK